MSVSVRVAWLYTTFADMDQAAAFADAVLEERLAACVNALPSMRSFYRWQGETRHDAEIACLVKTHSDLKGALLAFAKTNHPYETPALLWFDTDEAGAEFAAWIAAETRSG